MLRLFSSTSNHCHTCVISRSLPHRRPLRPPVLRSTRRRVLVGLLVLWPLVLGRCCLAFAPTLLRTSHRAAGLRRYSALGLRTMASSTAAGDPPPPLVPTQPKSTRLHIATFNGETIRHTPCSPIPYSCHHATSQAVGSGQRGGWCVGGCLPASGTVPYHHMTGGASDKAALYTPDNAQAASACLLYMGSRPSPSLFSLCAYYPLLPSSSPVCVWSVLAPVYKRLAEGQGRESQDEQLWPQRASALCDLLQGDDLRTADVLCLQEVWARDDYMAILRERLGPGYDLVFHQRTGMKADGLLVLLKKGRFRLKKAQGKTLCSTGSRVCLLLHLEVVEKEEEAEGEGEGPWELIVATTHLSFPNSALDRLSQRRQVRRDNHV